MSRVCNTCILVSATHSFAHTNPPPCYHKYFISVRVRMITHKYSHLSAHTTTPIYNHTQILLFISTHKYSFSLSHTNTPAHFHTPVLHLLTRTYDPTQILHTYIHSHRQEFLFMITHQYCISLHVLIIPYKYSIHVSNITH